jgi:hypothetical protein
LFALVKNITMSIGRQQSGDEDKVGAGDARPPASNGGGLQVLVLQRVRNGGPEDWALPLWLMHAETARIGSGPASRYRRLRISLSVVHENDPFEGGIGAEVHQETEFDLGCFQRVIELRSMPRMNSLGTLDFDNQAVIDQEIRPKMPDSAPPKPYINWVLSLYLKASLFKYHFHGPS